MDIINGAVRKKKLQKTTVRRESRSSIPERSSNIAASTPWPQPGSSLLLPWEDARKLRTVGGISANFEISHV